MTDYSLEFIGRTFEKLQTEMREGRQEQATFQNEVRDRFERLEIGQAALSPDIKTSKEKVFQIDDRLMIVEGRLHGIDGRLARMEKHTGLVKA